MRTENLNLSFLFATIKSVFSRRQQMNEKKNNGKEFPHYVNAGS